MVQTFLGFEVLEERLKYLGKLGAENTSFKLEDTLECVNNLRRAFYDKTSHIEVFPDIAMVCFWYGDADGDPNSYTVKENGRERVYHWNDMSNEQCREFDIKRRVFAKEKGYVK